MEKKELKSDESFKWFPGMNCRLMPLSDTDTRQVSFALYKPERLT